MRAEEDFLLRDRTARTATDVPTIQLLRAGKWLDSATGRFGDVYNPSSGKVIAKVPFSTAAEVNQTIEAAAAALPE